MKHFGPISGVAAFKGRWVATAGYDNRVILWDAISGQAVARGFHDHLANQCAFSPCGGLLVTASSDYSARIWSVPDLRLRALLGSHDDDVEMATFSPDGDRVATSSRDCTAAVFDIAGRPLARFTGHGADVISIAWSRDGEEVVTSSDDGTIRRWNSRTGEQLSVVDLEGMETDTTAIGPNGAVYAGDDAGVITTFLDGYLGKVQAHAAGIKRLVLDATGTRMASLSYDRRMVIWHVDGACIDLVSETTLPAIVWPRSAAFIDATRMALATFGSTYAVFDAAAGDWAISQVEAGRSINAVVRFQGDTYAVGDAGTVFKNGQPLKQLGSLCNFLLPVGHTLLAGGQMGILFDALSGEVVHQHRSPLNCGVAYAVDGQARAIIGAYTGEGLVFSLHPGGLEHVTTVMLHRNAVKGLGSSGGKIFSVCANGDAALLEAASLERLENLPDAHDRIANGCVGMPDGRFASVSRDLKVRIWDGASRQILQTPHRNSIKCISASQNGRWLATGSYCGHIAIYDLEEGRWVTVTRPTAAGISSLAPNDRAGNFLASSYDGQIHEVSVHPLDDSSKAQAFQAQDEFFMDLALQASRYALPECLPNPPIGCVIVRDGQVLAEGYTHPPGQFHAEAHALSQLAGSLEGATAYVTLEPCSFHGRTPSCALSLIARGIGRVVVSLVDSDPRNNGKGIALLRDNGIPVTAGVLADQVSAFICPHLNLPANQSPQTLQTPAPRCCARDDGR